MSIKLSCLTFAVMALAWGILAVPHTIHAQPYFQGKTIT